MRHLTGRIGELYTAMVTRGQMAMAVNQVGYDVVSADGDKISVKTFTSSTRINFSRGTLDHATRVMVLQIVIDENEPSIRELLDCSVEDLISLLRDTGSDLYLPVNRILRPEPRARQKLSELKTIAAASWRDLRVMQLENGTILVEKGGDALP